MTRDNNKVSFATFPEFSKLTFADRGKYEARVSAYPPIADINFATLMTWWSSWDGTYIAELNGNLVIQYWRQGEEDESGLSLIGENNVDESICAIFDYLQQIDEPVHLINVPEFTLAAIDYPELFNIKANSRHDEYLVSASRFYPIENLSVIKRRRVERLIKKFGSDEIVLKSLDMNLPRNQSELILATTLWHRRGMNSFGGIGLEAYIENIRYAEALGLENVCIYAKNQLIGYCLYEVSRDKKHVIMGQIQATHKDTINFDLMSYLLSKWFTEQGFEYANIGADGGKMHLRMFMMALGPNNFFRKYEIKPAG